MNNNFLHIIYIPFTGVGTHGGYRGEKWFIGRINVFVKYTLSSLLNQTEKNFVLWISFRKKEMFNPLVDHFRIALSRLDIKFIFTFEGLMYYDDKGNKSLRVFFKNRNLEKRIKISLNQVWSFIMDNFYPDVFLKSDYHPKDWIYVTHLDSDDMLHKDAVREIQEIANPPYSEALIYDKGYIYNKNTKELAEYNPLTNPPFHTILFPREVFFDAKKHLEYYKGFKSHEDIPRIFNYNKLPDYRYCVVVHGKEGKEHISNVWNHPFRGGIIEDPKEILKDFGI